MNWLTRLLTGTPHGSKDPSIHCIRFDTGGWTSTKVESSSLEWRNAEGDTLCARVRSEPTGHPSALSDLESLRAFYRQEAARHGGGIVCVDTVRVGGIRAVKVINKYERRPAYAYEGMLTTRFKNAQYMVTMHSVERGVTGGRDALVTAHLAGRGELQVEKAQDPGAPGKIKGWFQDPYDPNYQGLTLYSMSDDERLDALFPRHPLSKVRAYLTQIQNTLAIDPAVARDSVVEPTTRELEGAGRARYLLSSGTVGTLYLSVGMFDRAERFLAESVAELEQTAGMNELVIARYLVALGLARDCQEKLGAAVSDFSRARSIFEAALGRDHPDTAEATNNLARMYVSLGRHDEAEPLFLDALKVFEEKNVPGSNAGVALNGLGLIRNARGLYAQAIPYFERALEIFERVHGPEFPDCATVLRNMAFSLHKSGDDARAEKAMERARRIDDK